MFSTKNEDDQGFETYTTAPVKMSWKRPLQRVSTRQSLESCRDLQGPSKFDRSELIAGYQACRQAVVSQERVWHRAPYPKDMWPSIQHHLPQGNIWSHRLRS